MQVSIRDFSQAQVGYIGECSRSYAAHKLCRDVCYSMYQCIYIRVYGRIKIQGQYNGNNWRLKMYRTIHILYGKFTVKRPLGRTICRWRNNTKQELEGAGCERGAVLSWV